LLRQYSIIIGIILGCVLSYAAGVLTDTEMEYLANTPLLAVPSTDHIAWSFDAALILPFFAAVVCTSLKTMGNITMCQKANDVNWKRLDLKTASRGLFTEGFGTCISGLIGAMGLNSSSGSVGLSIATGATSRYLAFLVGPAFIAMAFFPKIAALLAILPKPVVGAILMVNMGYFIVEGFRIIVSRMLDSRKIFMIGLALVFGLGVDMMPGIYADMPEFLQPVLSSSIAMVSLVAILLNLIFRIGIKQHQVLELTMDQGAREKVADFMEANGALWGARREVVYRALAAITEFLESASTLGLVKDNKLTLDVSFEEFSLDINIYYQGILMEFPEKRPTEVELLEDEHAFIKLSGFLMRKYADKIKSRIKDDSCHIQFHFDH